MQQLDFTYPKVLDLFGGHAMTGRANSRAFLAWFLENYYRLEETEVHDCICDGSYDKGIDGLYVNDEIGQIDVFQSSIAQGKKTQGDVTLKEFVGTLSQFKDPASVRSMEQTSLNHDLVHILQDQEIAKKVGEGYEVRGVFVTNAVRDQNAIDILAITPNLVLYDQPELQQGYIHPLKTGPIATSIKFNLQDIPSLSYGIGSELEMLVAPVLADDLVRMDGIVNGELFAWNVRQWLGKKTKVNKDVEKSIIDKAEHQYFPAFHNGLTVLCQTLEPNEDKTELTISGYAVVNGCQSLTGLYANKSAITPSLKILTKFIKITPESKLALKITDHANNQNGISGRDLKSNHPVQTRLQSEIHAKYPAEVYYRIKRGEHSEWDQKKVIENELAARILLAFDLRQPWTCHQTYKLFDELHGRIFARPEVNADRIVALHDVFVLARQELAKITNQLFGSYGLTVFFLMYVIREALETDSVGKAFCANPSTFLEEPNGKERLRYAISTVARELASILDTEITLRNESSGDNEDLFGQTKEQESFDYKRQLKNPKPVRELKTRALNNYTFLVRHYKKGFSKWWEESEAIVTGSDSTPQP